MKAWSFRSTVMSLCAVLVFGGVAFGLGQSGEGDDTVVAQFVSAAPLVDGNQVKIDGVVVGKVLGMKVRGGHADVTMKIGKEAWPLHKDATFTIRPVSLLGERYVDLDRGDPKQPAFDPKQPVPTSQTGVNVELDDVLNTLDDPTAEGLATLVTTLGDGMRGNGKNTDKAIRALTPSMRDTAAMTVILKEHNVLLNSLVDNFTPLAVALAADDGKALDKVVASSDQLLAAATAQQKALEQTLERLPKALNSARTSLGHLARTSDQTTPTLAELRPLTDNLPAVSRELKAFADALDPALATSEPVLQRAEKLIQAAAPVARDLKAAGPDLATTVHSARPVVAKLTANRENVFNFIRYWALTTNGSDGLSHYFRVNITASTDTVTGLLPVAGSADSLGTGGPLPELSESKKSGGLSGLLGNGGGLLGNGGQLPLLKLPGAGKSKSVNPTGLSEKQESSMLSFLFGGN